MKIYLSALVLCGCATDMAGGVNQFSIASVDASSVDASIAAGIDASKAVDTNDVGSTDTGTIDTLDAVVIPTCATNCDDNNPCTTDTCKIDQCQHDPVPLEQWLPCNDNDPCTLPDACIYGKCTSVGKVNCDDKNPCTTDACTGKAYTGKNACVYTNNTSQCDDGNACTTNDLCQDGACKSEKSLTCNDNNPCTTDSCDKFSGNCEHTPVQDGTTCDDINGCTKYDQCQAGKCLGQKPSFSVDFKSEDAPFTCVPCIDDGECVFQKDTFCLSGVGFSPSVMYKPTGKCIAHSCEFKMGFCGDGNVSTLDTCIGGDWSPQPNIKAGMCEHQQFPTGKGSYYTPKTEECWCTNSTEMKCVTYAVEDGVSSNEKYTTYDCPNGCGAECKGFKDQINQFKSP